MSTILHTVFTFTSLSVILTYRLVELIELIKMNFQDLSSIIGISHEVIKGLVPNAIRPTF